MKREYQRVFGTVNEYLISTVMEINHMQSVSELDNDLQASV